MAVALGIETDLVTPLPLATFHDNAQALEGYLTQRLSLAAKAEPCAPGPMALAETEARDELEVTLQFLCPEPLDALTLRYLLFFDIDQRHRALGRLDSPGRSESFFLDREVTQLTFKLAGPEAGPEVEAPWVLSFPRILLFGVEHILIGYDHVLFLIALIMVPGRFWALVKIITAFTLAHSITLALAWFDLLRLPINLVESAIAFSIFYVAVENIVARSFPHRWVLAGLFGLLHGLGFYSVLSQSALAKSGALTALIGFNLGVELGQLLVLVIFLGPLVWWWRRRWYPVSRNICCLGLAAFAAWLTISRLIAAA